MKMKLMRKDIEYHLKKGKFIHNQMNHQLKIWLRELSRENLMSELNFSENMYGIISLN